MTWLFFLRVPARRSRDFGSESGQGHAPAHVIRVTQPLLWPLFPQLVDLSRTAVAAPPAPPPTEIIPTGCPAPPPGVGSELRRFRSPPFRPTSPLISASEIAPSTARVVIYAAHRPRSSVTAPLTQRAGTGAAHTAAALMRPLRRRGYGSGHRRHHRSAGAGPARGLCPDHGKPRRPKGAALPRRVRTGREDAGRSDRRAEEAMQMGPHRPGGRPHERPAHGESHPTGPAPAVATPARATSTRRKPPNYARTGRGDTGTSGRRTEETTRISTRPHQRRGDRHHYPTGPAPAVGTPARGCRRREKRQPHPHSSAPAR